MDVNLELDFSEALEKPSNTSVNATTRHSNNKKIKVVSLFSGCGGMDLGFQGGLSIMKKWTTY